MQAAYPLSACQRVAGFRPWETTQLLFNFNGSKLKVSILLVFCGTWFGQLFSMIHLIQLLSALIGNVHHWWKLVRPSLTELLITPKTVCLASYVELEIHIESIACLWSSDCSLFLQVRNFANHCNAREERYSDCSRPHWPRECFARNWEW